MKRLNAVAFVIVCSWLPAIPCLAQPSDTDPFQEYQRFLNEHQDMTAAELLSMYPSGDFQEQVGQPWESVVHHDLIDAEYNLLTIKAIGRKDLSREFVATVIVPYERTLEYVSHYSGILQIEVIGRADTLTTQIEVQKKMQ